MPSKIRLFLKYLEKYQENMIQRNLSQRYIREFYRSMKTIGESLQEAKLELHPKKIGKEEVAHVLKNLPGVIRTQKYYFEFFRMFLEFHGNNVVKEMRITWPKYRRKNVRWLNTEEQNKIVSVANLEERILIALELGMGLRRKEVRLLTTKDINLRTMMAHVQGKGKMGGKWRTVPIHESFPPIYEEYLLYRDGLIREAMLFNHGIIEIPENLILYRRGKRLDYKKNRALDNIHYRVIAKSGVEYSHHALRRSFGRNMWKLGVPIETIADIMGHESTQQTKDYLCINVTDMGRAMKKYSRILQFE